MYPPRAPVSSPIKWCCYTLSGYHWRLEKMQGKYQVPMRHKISGCHCSVYNCDFRPYCLGDWIVAVKLTAQIHNLCDYPSSAWTMEMSRWAEDELEIDMSALPQSSKDKWKWCIFHGLALLLSCGRADSQQAGGYKPLELNFKVVQRQSGFKIFMEVFFFHSLFHYLSLPSF